ncbi:hypothetical protein Hanom_Chr04g00323531 [Helianthus anomalus]
MPFHVQKVKIVTVICHLQSLKPLIHSVNLGILVFKRHTRRSGTYISGSKWSKLGSPNQRDFEIINGQHWSKLGSPKYLDNVVVNIRVSFFNFSYFLSNGDQSITKPV